MVKENARHQTESTITMFTMILVTLIPIPNWDDQFLVLVTIIHIQDDVELDVHLPKLVGMNFKNYDQFDHEDRSN